MNWQADLRQLILKGQYLHGIDVPETQAIGAVALLRRGIKEDSDLVLEAITTSYHQGIYSMIPVTMVLLLSQKSNNPVEWEKFQFKISQVIQRLDPKLLVEIATLLRNKTFGIGLGSRSQNILRRTMEMWTGEQLEFYIATQSRFLYSLLKLIHPRYDHKRGKIIRVWMYEK